MSNAASTWTSLSSAKLPVDSCSNLIPAARLRCAANWRFRFEAVRRKGASILMPQGPSPFRQFPTGSAGKNAALDGGRRLAQWQDADSSHGDDRTRKASGGHSPDSLDLLFLSKFLKHHRCASLNRFKLSRRAFERGLAKGCSAPASFPPAATQVRTAARIAASNGLALPPPLQTPEPLEVKFSEP